MMEFIALAKASTLKRQGFLKKTNFQGREKSARVQNCKRHADFVLGCKCIWGLEDKAFGYSESSLIWGGGGNENLCQWLGRLIPRRWCV
jgi:hypothetical protein